MNDTPRYDLSWTWASAAMGCHAALEEIGVPYTLRFIDFEQSWPEEDLALNPNRKVPTLIDHGGKGGSDTVVYQSGAILLYLADNHPEATLLPPAGSPDRAACYQWMFFMAEMLQPSFHMFFYPERQTTEIDSNSLVAVQTKGIEWVADLWGRIDSAIGDGDYFLGATLSVCDLYLIPMARWTDSDSRFPDLNGYPNLQRVVSRIRARPAVQRMLAAHCND